MVAYADDVTLIIEASSRADIEKKAQIALRSVEEWGQRNRLSFSTSKMQSIAVKGRFKRPPTIRMGGISISHGSQVKILGVIIDEAGSYVAHAQYIGQKASNSFGKVARVSASTWGIRFRALRILYTGTYVATLTYAAAVWWRRASHYAVRSALLRTQRQALVLLTKAYRSVSTAALPVLAGVLPADLEVSRAGSLAQSRAAAMDSRERSELKREAWAEAVARWQDRWSTSSNGRDLHSFFPDVQARVKYGWIEPDYVVSQLLTGHGNFRKRLHGMALSNDPSCFCGSADETRDHILWECEMYREEREEMLDNWKREETSAIYHQDLVKTKDGFQRLKCFAHKWHKKRISLEI